MARTWIETRTTGSGQRFRVRYRLGGRESVPKLAGTFRTKREARIREAWVLDQFAAGRVPELGLATVVATPTVRDLAARFVASRVDVSAGTKQTYEVNLGRILPALGDRVAADLSAADVAEFAAGLSLARESARKTVSTLAQVLDFGEIVPNPARSKRVKLSGERPAEVNPPTADHVTAVFGALPHAYRLPLVVLDATGMRVSELEALRWGDVDEPERRFRVSKAKTKTRTGRWVPVPENVFQAVLDMVPREDRDLEGQVFAGFANTRFRTALARACKATGTPLFSPHDLRHRRATLWHLSGMPAAEAAAKLGHSPTEHLRTYAHVVLDRAEIDVSNARLHTAGNDHLVHTRVHTSR